MPLASDTKFGPYEIESPLGAGGMGEVYRARDTRLGRDVALKILPESFAGDSDRLRRFEQEARAVAALNHPNILAVFDIGERNGSPYLISELLEGETLREALDRGALSQRKAIEYAVQIAQGLAAAHDKGIVHRDLKPENIFVTKDGRIKLLDFGLAKLAQKPGAAGSDSDAATRTSSHTAAGVVMGTAAYMAPEQVRGEPADPRTDIFAFGAVVYEMLSGQRAFRRNTPAETMTAILKEDPPEFETSHPISPTLDRIIRRCLEKSPEQRFQSARDLSFALGALSGTDSSAAPRVGSAPRRFPLWIAVSLMLATTIGSAATWWVASRTAPAERMEFAIPEKGEVSHIALSADGSMLVFVSPDEHTELPTLYVQRVGSSQSRELPGTEGASYPFWSPDGASVAFFAKGKLQKVSIAGGTPQFLANVLSARGGSWGAKDVIIYAPDAGGELWRVNADGTGASALTTPLLKTEEDTHRWPLFLPDGNHFLFWAGNFGDIRTDRTSGIFLTSLDAKEKQLIVHCHSSFALTAGQLIYANDTQQLVSVAFDPSKAAVSGNVDVIAESVGYQSSVFWAAVTAARNGTVVFNTTSGATRSVLTWMDRSGKELGRLGAPAVMANPAISPDGTRVALDISDPKATAVEVWIERVDGSASTRFTFDGSEDVVPLWSHDGTTLAFRRNSATGPYLTVKKATGLQPETNLLQVSNTDDAIPNAWSADDAQVLFMYMRESKMGSDFELIPAAGGEPHPFVASEGHKTNAQLSPDGKWLAYASDESGDWEIYVTTFPGGAGKWQVSRGGGAEPRWRGDGKEIFYLAPGGMMTAAPVSTTGTFASGSPVPLFQFHGRAPISSTDMFSYDVTKDGKRFLVNRYMKPDNITPLTIVLNAGAKSAN